MVLAHTKIESPAKEKIPHYNTLEVYVNKLLIHNLAISIKLISQNLLLQVQTPAF